MVASREVLRGLAYSATCSACRPWRANAFGAYASNEQLRDDMRFFFFSGLVLNGFLTGDVVQFFNRVIGQLQASAGYILSQMLNR